MSDLRLVMFSTYSVLGSTGVASGTKSQGPSGTQVSAASNIVSMQLEDVRRYLDSADEAAPFLRSLGIEDAARGHANLLGLATSGLTLDLVTSVCQQLDEHLPSSSDPAMALNNLHRFVAAARNPLSLGALFDRDREAMPILLQIFATSQHLSDLLITDPESYDLLRLTEGQAVHRDALVAELVAEVVALAEPAAVMTAMRRFKRRETLRVAYGDIIRGQNLGTVTRQISYLADAVIEAAVQAAWHNLEQRRPVPLDVEGERPRFCVLALGKLGGVELNYSSDIDLVFLFDAEADPDSARQHACAEFCDRLARETLKMLSEPTDLGIAYRVDLRLRPAGQSGPIVTSLGSALQYYDVSGRTWERQAFVKARAVAGDLELGRTFLAQLEPWIYRRYLSRADITGIKALKRRIEHRTLREGGDRRDVKTGHGGIRDVEFVIQFLQLLNGGDLPTLRTGNTLEAIAQLEQCGCLTHQEQTLLGENYAFLRKIEHRLQIMFDLQTHMLPQHPAELRKLAIRMGYEDAPDQTALDAFTADFKTKTQINRKILDHLLHDAFGDDAASEPESDLVLDPEPSPQHIDEVLRGYRFADSQQAYRNLMELATEKIRFLSTRRCRHFLAAIAPRLLKAISETPDPDFTLVNLSRVSDSLGGKGVLWELFSFNPPTLRLYVELCSSSEYLSSILTSNPGMLDELLDSLLLDRLPTLEWLEATLVDLCRGAEDLDPILHSFKNAQQLRVGVRDILGKERIEATTGALSDIAQACLAEITRQEHEKLVAKLGMPSMEVEGGGTRPCEFVVLALGKFGGRELNYYSDLDIVFLYEADGQTVPVRRTRSATATTNQHFYSELGQRIMKVANSLGPHGRLYAVDPRLRPTGKSGALATSLPEFERYFAEGLGQLWERLALCQGRVVFGAPPAAAAALAAVHHAAYSPGLRTDDWDGIREMRERLEATATTGNLKRGAGGLVDIEFLAQTLQLRHGATDPAVRVPGTLPALAALHTGGYLADDDFEYLSRSFRFLRTVQARTRLLSTTARDVLPEEPRELAKLAKLVGYESADALLADTQQYTRENRRRFERLFEAASV